MSHGKDIDERAGASDAAREALSERLLDLLYGEASEGDSARGASAARDGQRDELGDQLAAYREMRAMFRAMPDEEPSAAVSAKILHAASARATRAEASGLWAWLQRLFQPLMMHPGLAAAASLILVVGIGGTLYVVNQSSNKGRDSIAAMQPERSSPTSSAPVRPVAVQGPADEAPAAEEAAEALAGDALEGAQAVMSADFADPGALAAERQKRPDDGARGSARGVAREKSASTKVALPTMPEIDNAPVVGALAEDDEGDKGGSVGVVKTTATGRASGGSGGIRGGIEVRTESATLKDFSETEDRRASRDDDAPATTRPADSGGKADSGADMDKSPPAPTPAKKRAEKAPKPAPEQAPSADPAPPKESPAAQSERLHTQAIDAANRGDCAKVTSIASSLQKSDRSYYDSTFRRDARLAKCLAR